MHAWLKPPLLPPVFFISLTNAARAEIFAGLVCFFVEVRRRITSHVRLPADLSSVAGLNEQVRSALAPFLFPFIFLSFFFVFCRDYMLFPGAFCFCHKLLLLFDVRTVQFRFRTPLGAFVPVVFPFSFCRSPTLLIDPLGEADAPPRLW